MKELVVLTKTTKTIMSNGGKAKPKHKRFDKRNAVKFQLMHRSQLDPLYDEEGASKMVLHPVDEFTESSDFYQNMRNEQETKVEQTKQTADVLSAVDQYGMPKDGYDYKQHLKTSGGGVLILPDGSTQTNNNETTNQLSLATLAEDQPERMFEAITLTTDGMPEDIRQALDSDYDEEFYDEDEEGAAPEGRIIGEFEELQLDFIQAASVEPEESVSFDFDAHIARLMRRADGIFSDAEDDDEEDDNERKKDGSKADNEEEYDEDGEEFDLEALGISEADFGGPVPDRTKEDSMTASRTKRDLDDQFDVLWAREYGDQAIGNLDEELADEDGLAEQVDGLKLNDATIDTLMEEFLKEEEERTMPLILQQNPTEKEETERKESSHGDGKATISTKLSLEALNALQYEDDAPQTADALAPDTGERTDQGWSREDRFLPKRLRETWDSETIVSTYSNVSNHPSVIGQTTYIQRRKNKRNPPVAPSITTSNVLPIGELGRYDDSSDEEEEDDNETNDNYDSEEDGGDSKGESAPAINKGVKRPKKETKAEKKARKSLLKQERKARRQIKKSTKQVFKEETKKQLKSMRPSDGISITPLN